MREIENDSGKKKGDKIEMDTALKLGETSLKNAFPGHCDPKCIRAQLREYYEKVKCTPKLHDGKSGKKDKGTL